MAHKNPADKKASHSQSRMILFFDYKTDSNVSLRWLAAIYLRGGSILEIEFSASKRQPISVIFGILNKECSNFTKRLILG